MNTHRKITIIFPQDCCSGGEVSCVINYVQGKHEIYAKNGEIGREKRAAFAEGCSRQSQGIFRRLHDVSTRLFAHSYLQIDFIRS